jgi:hypothetical protein
LCKGKDKEKVRKISNVAILQCSVAILQKPVAVLHNKQNRLFCYETGDFII